MADNNVSTASLVQAINKLNENFDRVLRQSAQSNVWDRSVIVPFISTPDPSRPWNYNYIDPDGISGMSSNLEDCAVQCPADGFGTFDFASAAVPTTGNNYSTELMPVADLSDIYKPNIEVLMKSVFFTVIDSTYDDGSTTWTNLIDSLATDRAYMQTQFTKAPIPMFMPNMFRPIVTVGNVPRWGGNLSNSAVANPVTGAKDQKGHKTIGIPNPYTSDDLNIYLGKVDNNSISVRAFAGQQVADKIQRYPVYAAIEFLLRSVRSDGVTSRG